MGRLGSTACPDPGCFTSVAARLTALAPRAPQAPASVDGARSLRADFCLKVDSRTVPASVLRLGVDAFTVTRRHALGSTRHAALGPLRPVAPTTIYTARASGALGSFLVIARASVTSVRRGRVSTGSRPRRDSIVSTAYATA
jgi:hypothetical protein